MDQEIHTTELEQCLLLYRKHLQAEEDARDRLWTAVNDQIGGLDLIR